MGLRFKGADAIRRLWHVPTDPGPLSGVTQAQVAAMYEAAQGGTNPAAVYVRYSSVRCNLLI
jgi:hypothetical protein